MIEISFKKAPVFGERSKFIKAKVNDDSKWRVLRLEEFLNMKVEKFFEKDFRCMVELKVDGKVFRIVTHKEEYEFARQKFPNDLVIHLSQLTNLWKTVVDYKRDIPKLLLPIAILGAEVM